MVAVKEVVQEVVEEVAMGVEKEVGMGVVVGMITMTLLSAMLNGDGEDHEKSGYGSIASFIHLCLTISIFHGEPVDGHGFHHIG